ncbi:RagB/SusD family nutrient uptake outer membrane protein [Bacteroides sp. 51]|uniref:RagB/SusD family nutrient uptake outer membrane protein n=1 Tax=Bacteroides sp. 51 TaxID=2302938 RepID=UPI0013D419EB|nr:RagB/SusD family nutrient uptake outer membrane protein [Bacteroides sp. 51]NDV84556.1 RagB/SusD family nutrient uptake outer membrane protein [Bacteroides sp. 51]
MKRISIIVCTITLLFVSGCSLDESNYGSVDNTNFYEKQSDIDYALTGAYLQLRQTWNEWALNHYFIGDCNTDDAINGGKGETDKKELYDLSTFNVYSTNSYVSKRWDILYALINRCNDVTYYAPNATGDPAILERYINEAKLLRAFGYYMLVTSFGGVPLFTEPLTPEQAVYITRATEEEVYTQIIADLTDASDLPAKGEYPSSDQYRATSGLAKVLLGKTYMFRRDYPNAEKYLKEVVDSRKYDLLPDYGLNWTKENENSIESVFEIPNKVENKAVETGTNVPHYFISRNNVPGYQGYGYHAPSQDLYDAFSPDDPRITYVFTQTGDRYVGDTQTQSNSAESGYQDYKLTVPAIDKIGFDVWMISYNIRLIRYSDILLLYAEALNENGKSGEALTYLNKVRQRARNTNPEDPRRDMQVYIPATNPATSLPDVTTTDKVELRNAIWYERRCELAMEGWRREDLLRQKRFGEVMKAYAAKYNTEKGANFNDARDYLLPIPLAEIDKTNGRLVQNPHY